MQPEPDKAMRDSFIRYDYCVRGADLNHYGIMHGGRLLTLSDEVGFLAAHKHAGMDCLTQGVHQALFYQPARLGQNLVFEAQVAWVGNTSMWVPVRVYNQQDGDTVMEVIMVFVAVDENMRPRHAPPVRPGSESEQRLHDRIQRLRNMKVESGNDED